MAEMPEHGDNFLTRGPWRILTGRAWLGWQTAAVEAERRAAAAAGDEVAARRAEARLAALRRSSPVRPSLGGPGRGRTER